MSSEVLGGSAGTPGTSSAAIVIRMGFDINVGLFLCTDKDDEAIWPSDEREQFLNDINVGLRQLGLPEHREPRSLAEIDPPLPPQTDPCLLGAAMGSYSSHARRVDRLDWFARHVAVRGVPPATDPPHEPELYQAYDTLTDRRLTFDHLLAACSHEVILLPRPLDQVMSYPSTDGYRCFVSAYRLRAEAVALGFALRYADPAVSDSPIVDWITQTSVEDHSFAGLDARIPDDFDTWQRWAGESDLCHRLLQSATDVLRTGALGLTS